MRIEALGEGSGSGNSRSARAYEQARAYRESLNRTQAPATDPTGVSNAPTDTTSSSTSIAVKPGSPVAAAPPGVPNRTAPVISPTGLGVDSRAARRRTGADAGGAALVPAQEPVRLVDPAPPKMDSDGDGWIDVNDLPYDYFQIVRRTNIRIRTEPNAPEAF